MVRRVERRSDVLVLGDGGHGLLDDFATRSLVYGSRVPCGHLPGRLAGYGRLDLQSRVVGRLADVTAGLADGVVESLVMVVKVEFRLGHHGLLGLLIALDLYEASLLEDRFAFLRLGKHLVELVVRGQHHGIDDVVPGARAIRQTQPPPHHLLAEDGARRSPERHDRVEVVHVPSFLEHVDVDHDLDGIVRPLDVEEKPHVLVRLRPGLL